MHPIHRDPDWDLDPAALQYADPELDGEPQASTMDLGSTAYLLTLKGSLVSVLTYSDTSELYTTLMVPLPSQDPQCMPARAHDPLNLAPRPTNSPKHLVHPGPEGIEPQTPLTFPRGTPRRRNSSRLCPRKTARISRRWSSSALGAASPA